MEHHWRGQRESFWNSDRCLYYRSDPKWNEFDRCAELYAEGGTGVGFTCSSATGYAEEAGLEIDRPNLKA